MLHTFLNARVFKCYQKHPCQKFSFKVGTIFEDSPLGVGKWLPVMWMLANWKNGISSWEIPPGAVGVTQKTAWFMLQRARVCHSQDNETGGKLGGEVEVDETFTGGKARNMHKEKRAAKITGTGGKDKTPVLGILQRGGRSERQSCETERRRLWTPLSAIALSREAPFTPTRCHHTTT